MSSSDPLNHIRIAHLRCEYLVAPLGIDECAPRLSWTIESNRRGARQVAWRVRVASTAEKLAGNECDLWDSARVESNQTTHIVYTGRKLRSRDVCHWRVQVWDETGRTARSQPSFWTMGLLKKSDWRARWIAANPEIIKRDRDAVAPTLTDPGTPAYFRKAFKVTGAVKRATLYASARGLFELRLNGRRVGKDAFAPEWTDYDKRIHYRTYDVTGLVSRGSNVIGAILGDGWWSGYVGWQETRGRYGSLENSLLIQLEMALANGKLVMVGTNNTWGCNTGPILSSDFMMGETFDARRERKGWDSIKFSAEDWLPAREVAAPAHGSRRREEADTADPGHPPPYIVGYEVRLVAQRSEPVRITDTIAPVSVKKIRTGVFIYDLGQNITGWVRLRVKAPAGTRIRLRHGERLNPDGTLYTDNLRRAKATDVYICRGGGQEVWEPHFTFHGFQYVELTGLPAAPKPSGGGGPSAPGQDAVTGCVVHSATTPAGCFECSHAGVNRLWLNGLWSQRDNFLTVPTDCPQRDERLGWMGDAQVFLRTASYNMDVAAFFTKWMVDVEDAQTADGIFPDTAPRLREGKNFAGLDGLGGAAGWADAGIIVPWTIWQVYGDQRIIERHWRAMTAWLDWVERHNPDGLRTRELGNNYGDWLCIPSDTTFRTHSPMKNLLATAYWADDAAKMARMARELGREAEAKRFQAMFEKVRAAFQKEFLREDGRLTVETQTAYLLALAFHLLPEDVRTRAAGRLVENIKALDWHLSTGFIGVSHLNPQLTLADRADVAYRLLLREDYPSWLYPVKHGATTIWERWNGWTKENGFFNPQMNSFNHYSLGSVGEWLFRHVAGIELDPDVPGFRRFVMRPFIGPGLSFARAGYRSMHGEIASHWKCAGKKLVWTIRIPANTTARVYVPSEPGTAVTENRTPVEEAEGLRVMARDGRFLVCDAASGTYQFKSSWKD
ncbi:MAG TPA: family 78 glycoside hydrolase catalytic domain [Verrucomicrobiae bacterium]|nr:family 78 glycoside hydrolase catalytic domain [Verrucomicrobiae bacterium]